MSEVGFVGCGAVRSLLTLASVSKGGFLEALSRRLQASLVLFFGRWGLPIPYKKPLLYAIGNAIVHESGPVANPSPALVNEVHAKFVEAIKQLFEKYKHMAGEGGKSLVVL